MHSPRGLNSSGVLRGAVSSLLPPTNQCHCSFRDECQTAEYTKKITQTLKNISVDLFQCEIWSSHSGQWWRFHLSVMWHCTDWHHTYIPMYIMLYSRTLECWPSSMLFIPIFSSFYIGFHIIYLDLVSQKDMLLFKPRCRLDTFYCIITRSSS
jgi:hypothetical protein